MILWLYRLFLMPVTVLLLPLLALLNRKVRRGLKLRLKRQGPSPFAGVRPLWIHAASGEFEYAKSVIRESKRLKPERPILVTYFSPTYAGNAASFPGVDLTLPAPLDLPGPVASFLKKYNPERLWLARTDFWPEMLTQTRQRGIPIEVFSYSQRPFRGFFDRAFLRWRMGLVDRIHCVSSQDEKLLKELGLKGTSVQVMGDTRYDQVRFRLDHPKPLPETLKPAPGAPVMIAGSTWSEDERVLLKALSPLLKEGRLRLILVPHEPDPKHVRALASILENHGLGFAKFSDGKSWNGSSVLLVDKVGVLAELYQWGDLAFVGGSFRKSVHSVMEALGAGLVTFVGPHHLGNREAVEFQTAPGRPVRAVNNAAEFESAVREFLDKTPAKSQVEQEFRKHVGATERLLIATNRR